MDAAAGFVNINQNMITRIFLVAGPDRMNFQRLPEPSQRWGCRFALMPMAASAMVAMRCFTNGEWLR